MPRTYATGDRLALLAWATAQKLPAHRAGKTLTSARACEVPRRRVPPRCRRGSARRGGALEASTDYAIRLGLPRSACSRGRSHLAGDTNGTTPEIPSGGVTVDDMNASAWPNGRQVREPAGHGINFPQATEQRQFEKHRNEIVLRPAGDEPRVVRSRPSLWRNCWELRSANISRMVTR